MPTCPNCSHHWVEHKCGECGVTVTESEATTVGGRTRCTMCLAAAVGRKREAERPRTPDPEDDPQGWERAWRALRRR